MGLYQGWEQGASIWDRGLRIWEKIPVLGLLRSFVLLIFAFCLLIFPRGLCGC